MAPTDCAVGATLSTGQVEIHHAYIVRDASGREQRAEVVVTGPNEDPHVLGARMIPVTVGAA